MEATLYFNEGKDFSEYAFVFNFMTGRQFTFTCTVDKDCNYDAKFLNGFWTKCTTKVTDVGEMVAFFMPDEKRRSAFAKAFLSDTDRKWMLMHVEACELNAFLGKELSSAMSKCSSKGSVQKPKEPVQPLRNVFAKYVGDDLLWLKRNGYYLLIEDRDNMATLSNGVKRLAVPSDWIRTT